MQQSAQSIILTKALEVAAVGAVTVIVFMSLREASGFPFAFIALGFVCGLLRIGPFVTGMAVFLGIVLYGEMIMSGRETSQRRIAEFFVLFYAFSFGVIAAVCSRIGDDLGNRVVAFLDDDR